MMKTLTAALATVALVGCGGSDEPATPVAASSTSATAPSPAATTATATGLTEADLSKVVLTIDDLPTGWSTDSADSEDQPDFKDTSAECKARLKKQREKAKVRKEVNFKRGAGALLEQTAVANEPDIVSELRSVYTDCSRYSLKTDSGTAKVKIEALSFPKLGDESAAFAAIVEQGGQTFEAHVFAFRKGDIAVSTSITESFAPDDDLLEKAARTTFARIK